MIPADDPRLRRAGRRPDDVSLMQPGEPPIVRPAPRAATERLQAALREVPEVDETEAAPRGRRKFRDQSPIELRRQRRER